MPIMMAGADDPATLSGFRQPMAKAMADGLRPQARVGAMKSSNMGMTSRWKSRRRVLRSTICGGLGRWAAETR